MNPVHVLTTSARYSRLKPIQLQKRAKRWRPTMTPLDFKNTSTTDPPPKHVCKRGTYGRAIAFILFETTFLVFAFYCLFRPIPLQSNPDDTLNVLPSFNVTRTEFKAGMAVASVTWHALACLLIGDLIAGVRSAEFMAQYNRLGGLNSRTLDGVSTLTSGIVDNIIHFVRGSPTNEFRLALVVMFILTVIGPLGSGTFTVGTNITTTKEPIKVSNVTLEMTSSNLAKQRIPLIMRLEREESSAFKYDMHSSLSSYPVLIPWPHIDTSLPEQSTLIYQSDILNFRFQCSWMPSPLVDINPRGEPQIVIDNILYQWSLDIPDPVGQLYGIYPSFNVKDAILIERASIGVFSLRPIGMSPTPNATIMFITTRSSENSTPGTPLRNMSLSGIPHLVPLTWSHQTNASGPNPNHVCAILRCSPNASIVPATITLARNTLTAGRLHKPRDDSNLIGNIQSPGADIVTGLLATAINTYAPSANQMFLKFQWMDLHVVQQEPLSPDEMAAKINLYVQSAGKAVLDGLAKIPDSIFKAPVTFNQTVQVTSPVVALVSSKPFLITFTAVIGLIVMLLGALLWTIRRIELRPFNLENLIEILGSK